MFQNITAFFENRGWKFWAAVGGVVIVVILMLVFGENTVWTAE